MLFVDWSGKTVWRRRLSRMCSGCTGVVRQSCLCKIVNCVGCLAPDVSTLLLFRSSKLLLIVTAREGPLGRLLLLVVMLWQCWESERCRRRGERLNGRRFRRLSFRFCSRGLESLFEGGRRRRCHDCGDCGLARGKGGGQWYRPLVCVVK